MLIGERLNNGFHLYSDIYDHIGPLSAIVYQGIDFLFGRSHTAYIFLACLLAFIQAGLFNSFLLANKSYRENTYVPALMYGLFICYSFDFMTLSPQLMSVTFILLGLNNIFKRIDNKTRDELFLFTGFYLGIAVLFYFPTWIIFVTFLIILIVFSNAVARRLLLMAIGFVLVLSIVAVYFSMIGSYNDFVIQFIYSHWIIDQLNYTDTRTLIYLGILPLTFTVLGFIKIYGSNKFVNFQLKFQQAMLFLALGSLFIFINSNERSSLILVFLVPSLAFYGAHFLLLIKKTLWIHISSLLMLGVVLYVSYAAYLPGNILSDNLSMEDYFVESEVPVILNERKVAVLGDDLSYYQNCTPALPFINWPMSEDQLTQLEYYDNAVKILKSFKKDAPDLIVDQKNVMPRIFSRIPQLDSMYTAVPNYKGYYRLVTEE